ncbi:MAG TPA: winged helix-turn-helix domain-containing protein [Rhizomicrobium sp.]|nr:winged helix-turn-helix domain-containing protein [Rhizomicrobium sp.]
MPASPDTSVFRLRDRLVDPARNTIASPDGETSIEPKVMAVLLVLAGEPGRVFTRGQLIDLVWGTEYGADESLTRAISLLRKALGDNTRGDARDGPQVIETISKRGYRLLPQALTTAPPAPPPTPPVHQRRRALALGLGAGAAIILAAGLIAFHPLQTRDVIAVTVDPVNPVRREPAQESLSRALTVDLVGALARENRFHVTVRKPDPASRKGSGLRFDIYADVQTANGRLKSTVEIMDTDTGRALWSREYARAFDGSLAAQDALSSDIARDLIPALLKLSKETAWRSVA